MGFQRKCGCRAVVIVAAVLGGLLPTGKSVAFDFAAQQSGPLYQVDSETGEGTTIRAGSLTVPPTAVLVAATEEVSQTLAGPSAMFALHLDPDGSNGETENATSEHWEWLADFVAAADVHYHKLTLLMSSSWADLVAETPDKVDQLKLWIENGHQLGYHHHSCGHVDPDGYRDVTGTDCGGEDDRGSVQDSFAEVFALGEALIDLGADPEAARVEVAAQGPNDNNEYRSEEWQAEAIYATGTIDDNSDGHPGHKFITLPRCTKNYGNSYSGSKVTYEVPELGHAQLDVGDFTTIHGNNNLTRLAVEIDQVLTGTHAESGVHIGVVFHPREYYENPRDTDRDTYANDELYLDAVLQLFADKGLPVVTAREILQASSPCSSSLPGDFNGDQVVDDADIDILFTAITAGSEDLQFDLDSSNAVTSADATFLVESILGTRFGDTDLDRDVDLTDYNTLATHFNPSGTDAPYWWQDGNVDGDDDIDLSDYNSLVTNFNPLGFGATAVPEPAAFCLFVVGLLLLQAAGVRRPTGNG